MEIKECPQLYCFHWLEKDEQHLPFLFSHLEQATSIVDAAKPQQQARCGCVFGTCIRQSKSLNDKDRYEPNEPQLKKDGFSTQYSQNPFK
ncbi:hypothetical protein [Paenibacillus kandeliae]|uniref:hypothetical protein n=1 Tax=Paenibacillus kandeliae TaxID=3231269 RepID=UPI00345A2062